MSNVFPVILMLSSLVGVTGFKEASLGPKMKAEVGSGSQVLRLLNVEDYIYEHDDEDPESEDDLVVQFEEYARDLGYENVDVQYFTTDTPESMFNSVKMTPGAYDLICPSDYMIQKMASLDMLQEMDIDEDHMPNYVNNASQTIRNRLDNISAVSTKTGETLYLGDYAVGYMWGTLGLTFDPSYGDRDPDTFIYDAMDWSILWNPDYKGIASIKDSVRDTYAIGLLYALNDDFEENGQTVEGFETLMNKYNDGTYDADTYNQKFSDLFNRCDDATLEKVNKALNKLKGNVFGMEVDSGKEDIVTGKIGINFAWSGDAVNSMDTASAERDLDLYYSVPRTGSNIWMDAWCMPKSSSRSEAQVELANLFLDFISTPEYTALNMEYSGYTPFIAGDEILELTRSWYDYRYDEETEEFNDITYSEEEMEELGLQEVDLKYFFEGTLSDEYDESAYTFYSDSYLPFTYENEEGEEVTNKCVGGTFFCQFPDEETITRCAVMRDFGDQNEAVLKMWEKFKSDALPVWATVLFIVELALILGGVLYYFISKHLNRKLREKRRKLRNV